VGEDGALFHVLTTRVQAANTGLSSLPRLRGRVGWGRLRCRQDFGESPSGRASRVHLPRKRGRISKLLGHRSLELAQHGVAALHGRVECLLGGLLAGERRLDLLGPHVAQLHHVAEAQSARVLGRLLVGEL